MQTHNFYNLLIQEITQKTSYPIKQEAGFLRYYQRLASNKRTAFTRYNWTRRTEPMRQILLALPSREPPWRVLDAGCGLGTEAFYWSSLREDVEVLGVDISPERLALANARQPYYESQIGRKLNVRFQEQSIFEALESGGFDAVWCMEAISHIHPAERFLQATAANLTENGFLVISDSNRINPYMLWRIFRLRQKEEVYSQRTLSSGEKIDYAQERLFSVPELARLLRQAGFSHVDSQLSVFLPPALARFEGLYAGIDAATNTLPLLRQVGGIYTLTATF